MPLLVAVSACLTVGMGLLWYWGAWSEFVAFLLGAGVGFAVFCVVLLTLERLILD